MQSRRTLARVGGARPRPCYGPLPPHPAPPSQVSMQVVGNEVIVALRLGDAMRGAFQSAF
jgi:hypothetical protein